MNAGAESGDVGESGVGLRGGRFLGDGEGALPGGKFVLRKALGDGGADGGGVRERAESVGEGALVEFVVVGDVLPEFPRIARGGRGVPPT